MADRIENLDFSEKISKNELLSVLKVEACQMDIQKIMRATGYLREDAKYMPSPYREEYIERFSKAFFARIKDLKEDNQDYKGNIDVNKLMEILEVLKKQRLEAESEGELCFLKIARIIVIYTVFIREESVHPVGTKFPGGFTVRHVNGIYLCPVKEKQMNNPSALCRFCASVQDETAL